MRVVQSVSSPVLLTFVVAWATVGFAPRPGRGTDAAHDTGRRRAAPVHSAPGPVGAGAPRQNGAPHALLRPLYRMRTATANLRSPLHRKDEQAGVRAADCLSLATQLDTHALVGVLEAREGLTDETLSAVADALDGTTRNPDITTESPAAAPSSSMRVPC